RVEKELGGGGMSRVFLAEEVRLGRRVVIKVLPPEMAAGVSVDRFEREIQLAAKLQHPHVVPLLSAGSSDDLLYYIMPFIEGESLRAKLAREGELPVAEVLRILRDVLDALAYAHRHHVVHRDIKPDNVLLSEGHALVTDFGVAKAVAESTGKHTLTSMGVALGTPAYMAPEQATADPHTDHRADIYAVGAMAYEMLSGRPPFAATTAQAMLAAHVTEAPEPVTKHRTTVPAALNELILRCLEKKPADRWQRADELIPHVAAMLTPTGGITPSGTQPLTPIAAEADGAAAAAAPVDPLRVAGLFVASSLVVLLVVYAVVQLVGLPDWVFAGAIALLAIGLPIMLLTSHHERRRALARSSGRLSATPSGGLTPHFTWRKAFLGGGIAFATLGVVSAGYMAMRVLGIGPVGTLVASGVIGEGEPIILADFTDRTGDSVLAATFTEAFRVDLSQSPTVRLMQVGELRDALRRMQREATVLDVELAREVAEREGVKAVVAGEINSAGGGYVLSVRLVAPETGDALVALRETADGPTKIIPAIDRLSKQLRERIGESLKTIRANEPLAEVTTSSLEALRKYSQAYRAQAAGEIQRAIELAEEAIALDSTFAMAYRFLAITISNTFGQQSRVVAASRKAYEYRDRLPERERYLTIANYYDDVEFDLPRVIGAYRALLERRPEDFTALNNLSLRLQMRREWAEAEQLAARAIASGNQWQNYGNAVATLIAQGKVAEGNAVLKQFEERWPGSPQVPRLRAHQAGAARDFARVSVELAAMPPETKQDPNWRAQTSLMQFVSEQVRGRLAVAERHIREDMAAEQARGSPGGYVAAATELALLDLRYRNAAGAAVTKLEEALRHAPLRDMEPVDRPYAPLAYVYAEARQPERAKQLLREYEAAVPDGQRRANGFRHIAAAAVAKAEGRYREAVSLYRAGHDESFCGTCALFELGQAFEKAGEPDSALAVYERAVNTPNLYRMYDEHATLAPTYKRLGELYEERADRERALDYYARFVDLWKDADPELQPVVNEVRGRMARLVGEK
ncbi:MAG: protein kinase, partial [Gemmatimonadetes bacterium]|nr:protein kinase [Gemmatimonadota bacterium]